MEHEYSKEETMFAPLIIAALFMSSATPPAPKYEEILDGRACVFRDVRDLQKLAEERIALAQKLEQEMRALYVVMAKDERLTGLPEDETQAFRDQLATYSRTLRSYATVRRLWELLPDTKKEEQVDRCRTVEDGLLKLYSGHKKFAVKFRTELGAAYDRYFVEMTKGALKDAMEQDLRDIDTFLGPPPTR